MKTTFLSYSDNKTVKGIDFLSINEMFSIRGGGDGDDQGEDENKIGQVPPKENKIK